MFGRKIKFWSKPVLLIMLLSFTLPVNLVSLAASDFENSLVEVASPIEDVDAELYTDGMENLNSVFGGTKDYFQEFDNDRYTIRCWGDPQRIRPDSSKVSTDKYLIFAAPGENKIKAFAFWLYFTDENHIDDMTVLVSNDNVSYSEVECGKIKTDAYDIPEETGSPFYRSYYNCVYYLDNIAEDVKYIKLQWYPFTYDNVPGASSEGILGKAQIGYEMSEVLPIEIHGNVLTDSFKTTDKAYQCSGVSIDKSNSEKYGGDSARAAANSTSSYIIYRADENTTLSDFVMWTYFDGAKSDDFKFSSSADGTSYSDFTPQSDSENIGSVERVTYYGSDLPFGTKYFKITFPADDAQIGKLMLGNDGHKFRVSNLSPDISIQG